MSASSEANVPLDESPVVIIDSGSGIVKAGLHTDNLPSLCFPTIIGKPRKRYQAEYEENVKYIGDDALSNIEHLSISRPIDHGHIHDWIEIEEIWDYTFKKLGVETQEHPCVTTEPVLCSSQHRENCAELLLEVFGFPEINISPSGLMSIYGAGKLTGLVLEIGEGVTQCLPLVEGFISKEAVRRSDFGGEELTMFLRRTLCDMGYPLTTRANMELVQNIKKSLCFCSVLPREDMIRDDLGETFFLPDGETLKDGSTEIVLGAERIYPTEALFNPQLCERDSLPLSSLIWSSIMASAIGIRKSLLANVILSGGSTMFSGLPERLEIEIKNSAPELARSVVRVETPAHREFLPWVGCKVCSSPTMKSMMSQYWITKEEWDEIGSKVVHMKASIK